MKLFGTFREKEESLIFYKLFNVAGLAVAIAFILWFGTRGGFFDKAEAASAAERRMVQGAVTLHDSADAGSGIKQGEALVSQGQRSDKFDNYDVLMNCETAVKARLENPDTFSLPVFNTTIDRPATGGVVVNMRFEARDNGEILPFVGRCHLSDGGEMEVSVDKR